ncbi:MAG: TylF/MycF/NovP-related O-methyltransferase [Ferruginibacter sp.]
MKEINTKSPRKFPFFFHMYYFLRIATKWIITGKKDQKYYATERLANMFNPNFHFTEFGQVWRDDKKFEEYYVGFEGDNYHSIDRKYTVNQFSQLVKNVQGDTVECGSYKGATSYLICQSIQQYGQSKTHHIFDSFEGLSKPVAADGTYWKAGDLTTSEEVCRNNLSAFSFVKYYKGWIPDKFPEVKDLHFSFVHIDVDIYQPTLDSISFFYERLNKGGIMICDDYGFSNCLGAKKAMDDFFTGKPESVIMLTTGQAFIIKE